MPPQALGAKDGEYSAVERKTLMALGKERLEGWKITGKRQQVVPERVRIQEEMKRKEAERSRKLKEDSERGLESQQQGVAVA